jgi:two-component system nitrate/nitrite response regulator NarL
MVGEASEVEVAIAELASRSADVLLLGQPLSSKSVLPLLMQVKEANLQVATVLWVADLSQMDCIRALQIGALGIVRKTQPVEILLECLAAVANGSVFLERAVQATLSAAPRRQGAMRITPREREIVHYVCRGMKNKDIAEAMSITAGTVKVHLMHIFEKTGVKDRFQLALQGRQLIEAADQEIVLRKAAEA